MTNDPTDQPTAFTQPAPAVPRQASRRTGEQAPLAPVAADQSIAQVITARFTAAGIAITDVETVDSTTATFRCLAPFGVLRASVPSRYALGPSSGFGGSGTEFWKVTDLGPQTGPAPE